MSPHHHPCSRSYKCHGHTCRSQSYHLIIVCAQGWGNFRAASCSGYGLSCRVCLLVGCFTSKQHASVSLGWICSEKCAYCYTDIEVADQTGYLIQSNVALWQQLWQKPGANRAGKLRIPYCCTYASKWMISDVLIQIQCRLIYIGLL